MQNARSDPLIYQERSGFILIAAGGRKDLA